ncbi:hypothetical protein Lal_00040742 [Lupinus albus]|uniref:Uncharacterized protein n=1 Tax=Lupinus albus TaxID=3870 RepID=A0A6A5NVX0_LUPAL|nr:hypothetical protein Lalb_Chr13g0304361 [Lupinus albus]KAF1887145.1 hypothetical protein Lal_00040742 [Lupinus albus]
MLRKAKDTMGYFRVVFVILLLLLLLVNGSMISSPTQDEQDNSFLDLLSRDEAVQMAGYGQHKLSTVLITGSLLCHQPHAPPCPISGALVGVKCHSYGYETSVARGVSDEFGDFIVEIPSHLHAIPNLEKECNVKLHSIPKGSMCKPFQVMRHKGLRLSSFGNGIRTYTAGNIRIHHSPTTSTHY